MSEQRWPPHGDQKAVDEPPALAEGDHAIVTNCDARRHGTPPGCVCHLIGHEIVIGPEYDNGLAGTRSYWVSGRSNLWRVRADEVRPVAERSSALPPMPVRSEGFDGQPEVLAEWMNERARIAALEAERDRLVALLRALRRCPTDTKGPENVHVMVGGAFWRALCADVDALTETPSAL